MLVNQTWEYYRNTSYKLALKAAWFDLASAWSFYKEACAGTYF